MAANFWKSSHCEEWLVTDERLKVAEERDLEYLKNIVHIKSLHAYFPEVIRALADNLAQKGQLVTRHQQVDATAIVYFKRFYLKNPFTAIDPFLVATTSLYLAIKTEECGPMIVKYIHQAAEQVMCLPAFKDLWRKKFSTDEIIECEFILVQEMSFSLIVFHPYRPLTEYAEDAGVTKTVLPTAWSIVNDSYKSDVCLRHPPYLIAIAAMSIAATTIPNVDLTKWMADLAIDISDVVTITQEILDMYQFLADAEESRDRISLPLILIRDETRRLDAKFEASTKS